MTKYLLAGVAAIAMASGASAADLPRRTAPVAPVVAPPMFTWTGFYVGVTAGYGFENMRTTLTGDPTLVGTGLVPTSGFKGGEGFVGGLTVGYNAQFGQFVAGLEADLMYTDFGARRTTIFGPVTTVQTLKGEYLGTVRGRLGVAFDRFLVYATGGLAFGDQKATTALTLNAAPPTFWTGSAKGDFGYVVGLGGEYAFTNNITAKLEYLYYDLGRKNYVSPVVSGPNPGFQATNRARFDGQIVRAGLNYKF